MAAGVAPQARQKVVEALPPLSRARSEAATKERPAGGAQHRNMADFDRCAGWLSGRFVNPRQGLRIWRGGGRAPVRNPKSTRRGRGASALPTPPPPPPA